MVRVYADVEKILVDYLQFGTLIRCVTELPSELVPPETLPIIQVEETFGPGESYPSLDVCDVDISAYAIGRAASRDLAENIRALMTASIGLVVTAGRKVVINSVGTIHKPCHLPYDDSEIRRFGAAYRITLHSCA